MAATMSQRQALLERLYVLRDLLRQEQGAVIMGDLLPHQRPPEGAPSKDWDGWLIQAGRGAGKTAGIASYVTEHVESQACMDGPMPHRLALVAPTLGDADESAERHPISLKTLRPEFQVSTSRKGTVGRWPNGSEIKLFGTNTKRDVDRLRAGGNNCLVWVEELAAWPMLEEAWSNLQLGLRIGPTPHWVGSTTPKMRPDYEQIASDPRIIVTRASLNDNPHLDQSFRDRIIRLYGGTTLGAQEIEGELLDEIEGALWDRQTIEDNRIARESDMTRVVVGVDPSGGRDAVGIVAAGKVVRDCICGDTTNLPHAIVLGDFTDTTGSPDKWSQATVDAFDATQADRVVGERNFGGDMVESVIRTKRKNISYKDVTASRGKAIRAEPVKALYEQRRVHHLGRFPELESEMVTWVPDESRWSPNRLDALVWAITELQLSGPSSGVSGMAPGR